MSATWSAGVVDPGTLAEWALVWEAHHHHRRARPLPFTSLTTSKVLINVGGTYMGHSLVETTGTTPATLTFYDGTSSGGTFLIGVQLTPGQTTRDWYGPDGIEVRVGLTVVVTAGTVTGAAYFRPEHRG